MITVRNDNDQEDPHGQGESWTVMDDGVLVIDDSDGSEVAVYAPEAWKNAWKSQGTS